MKIEEGQPLSDILKSLSEEKEMLFAYPSDLVDEIFFEATEINYQKEIELLEQLLAFHNLDFYDAGDNRFLIRASSAEPNASKTIAGKLVDEETGETLPYASIYIPDFSRGVFSDNDGNFKLELDKDYNGSINISYLGYQEIEEHISYFENKSTIKMILDLNEIEDVLIEYVVPPMMLSKDRRGINLRPENIGSSTSGLYGADIFRNIQMMSGVAAFNDDQANLKIRGSNADESRILLDNIPLYNVNHYYGIFSSVNSAYVGEVQLYKNAQPIQHEGLGGGMLVMQSSNESNNDNNSLDINLLTASLAVNQSLNDNFRIKASGRTSYRNVNDARLLDLDTRDDDRFINNSEAFVAAQPDFRFYDISSGLYFQMDKSEASVNFFKSHDKLLNNYEFNFNIGQNSFDRNLYNNNESWSNLGFSANYNYSLSDKLKLFNTLYSSNYSYESSLDSELIVLMGNNMISNKNTNEVTDRALKTYIQYDGITDNLTFGAEYKRFDVQHRLEVDQDQVVIDYDENLNYFSTFIDYQKKIGAFSFSLGSRLPITQDGNRSKIFFSPQLSLSYNLDEEQFLKASFNRANQLLREFEYETRLGQTLSFYLLSKEKSVPVLESSNYMIGYNFTQSGFGFDLEFYFKDMDGAMQFRSQQLGFTSSQGSPGANQYGFYRGKKRVYGVDASFSFRKNNYSGWLAYTLSKTEEQFAQIFKGEYYDSQDDRRHQLKLINTFNFGKFDLSANLIYASGKKYLALERIEQAMDRNNLDKKQIIEELPAYFRFDLGLDYNFQIAKRPAQIGFSIFNLTNRQNVKYIQYSYRLQTNIQGVPKNLVLGTEAELLDRTLNLNFRISF